MAVKKSRLNGDITVPQIRLIDKDGENKGVVSIDQAMQEAAASSLDLVEIVPNAKPPVCRIMDFGKYRFEENKKTQQSKKRQKQTQVKEVKFRPTTDVGDFNVKMRNLKRFLDDGNKGKVTIRYRGRELAHKELGLDLLKRVEADLGELAVIEQHPKMEGRQMIMIVAPKKKT